MSTLNHNIPRFECYVREPFLYDFDQRHNGFIPGVCHAISTIAGRALGFHVLLANGAHIGRLPIHALVQCPGADHIPLDRPWMLQLWDCFSYEASVTEFDWLSELRVKVALPDGKWYGGEYMFTVDYYGSETAEAAGDAGWKCHHIIALDNKCYAAQPNNRICWYEPSCVQPFEKPPAFKTIEKTWKVEDGSKWRADDSDRMFYGVVRAIV